MSTSAKLRAIITELSGEFLERETTLSNAVLALLARQHHFVIGPIGAAKSAAHEAVVARITGANFFATQMHDAMKTDELFGQIAMPEYDRNNRWVRNTTGFLPWAHLVMVDEIDKGPHLLRSLLRVANERRWRNGDAEVELPLITMVASANAELGEDMAPVWDRFLIREQVSYIAEAENFLAMLTGGFAWGDEPTTITLAELQDASLRAVPAITVPEDVLHALWQVRTTLRARGVVASDRRWKDSVRLLQARAFLAGRTAVGAGDLTVLEHVLWTKLGERDAVTAALLPHVAAEARQIATVLSGLADVAAQLAALEGQSQRSRIAASADLSEKLARFRSIQQVQVDGLEAELRQVQSKWIGAKARVGVLCAGMSPAAAHKAAERAWQG